MITQGLHSLVQLSGWQETRLFKKALKNPVLTQQKQLQRILNVHQNLPWSPLYKKSQVVNLNDFPLTSWADYEHHLSLETRANVSKSQVVRFEPTSGSTHARKWIPYTPEFLIEINRAASVWMTDMYQQFPDIKKGPHYWSLSWLPHDLRSQMNNDDSELFPFWKRWLLSKIFLVPQALAKIKSEEAWRLATQVFLLSSPGPAFVSVWSPTFMMALFQLSPSEESNLDQCFKQKKWIQFENELVDIPFPKTQFLSFEESFQNLKKNLKLISCWMSASSQSFSENLKDFFSMSQFQGKGLWATEGVVTIPYGGRWPLALRSHYYEFLSLQSKKLVSLADLKRGDVVSPVLTTSSGLLRYELGDQLLVNDFLDKTPCFEFLGRSGTHDLVGEKLDSSIFYFLKLQLQKDFPQISFFQFGYRKSKQVSYCLALPRTEFTEKVKNHLADLIEVALQKYHHYRVARQLQQLQAVQIILLNDHENIYVQKTEILGQSKPSDLIDFSHL
ncbi:MAG: GH3 auxin-responsive promoter family protein [Bdellovibrionales bacterium]